MATTNGAQLQDILALQEVSPDYFYAPAIDSVLSRTYGGQVVAQAYAAVMATVDPFYVGHSLHSYFMLPGDSTKPMHIKVERLQDGRSFVHRQAKVIQNDKEIFHLVASFHRQNDQGIAHQDPMPNHAPAHEVYFDPESLNPHRRQVFPEFGQWDVRVLDDDQRHDNPLAHSTQATWFKLRDEVIGSQISEAQLEDPKFHQAAFSYISDMTLLHTAMVRHPDTQVQMASLDHAIWFMRPFRVDEWFLYDQASPVASSGRALTMGRVFSSDGELVAVVQQEGLTRTNTDSAGTFPMRRSENTK